MGELTTTLGDLLRPGLRAVCVGINPSPVSVAAGHYYQGRIGQRFFDRLDAAGVMPRNQAGYEDDVAFAAGIGFTDIVKRPTARATDVSPEEFDHGRYALVKKLEQFAPKVVIFTFKKTANVLFGDLTGNGFVPGLELVESDVFVMPGPYEKSDSVATTLKALAERVGTIDSD